MRHCFTPRTSVEKSDWHTWSPAPTPRLLPQGRGLPHCSLSPRWGEGQGEGKNMPATARQAPRAWAWRPDTFRWSCERSGGRRGVENQPDRGRWIRSGVNGKLPEEKSLRLNADRIWEDAAQRATHCLRTLGGHVVAHHLRHLSMSHHTEGARKKDCRRCYDSSHHENPS